MNNLMKTAHEALWVECLLWTDATGRCFITDGAVDGATHIYAGENNGVLIKSLKGILRRSYYKQSTAEKFVPAQLLDSPE